MEFLGTNATTLRIMLNRKNKTVVKVFIDYMYSNFDKEDLEKLPPFMQNKTLLYQASKEQYINLIVNLSDNQYFREVFADALGKSEVSEKLYSELIWSDYAISTKKFRKKVNNRVNIPEIKMGTYSYEAEKSLDKELSFVIRHLDKYSKQDVLYIKPEIKEILRFFYPLPDDYNLIAQKSVLESDFSYNNESKIFTFIKTFEEMLKNNLIKLNKSEVKPLAKTFKIVKQSCPINEFYRDSDIDSIAMDMLIRVFYHHHSNLKKQETIDLKTFVKSQFENMFYYPILRVFSSHLKGVQLGGMKGDQRELFTLVKRIIYDMPKDSWVDVENIMNYTYYRQEYFNFASKRSTGGYSMPCDVLDEDGDLLGERTVYVDSAHIAIFHEPIIKATFFYLGALGLMELKYNKPSVSADLNIRAKGKPYITIWDSLKYIKLTELGKYIFGFSKSYTPKEQVIEPLTELKFDEFKPIITVSKDNVIAIAKLESYVDKLDTDRYILSYSKLFKECDNKNALKLKIDGFYKNIEKNPPKVFTQFFDKAVKNSNLMKRNLKQIVIELEDNKELLSLFMGNRKLQELFIKAEGYRIIVLKENVSKVTKIVKDNGFFVEF